MNINLDINILFIIFKLIYKYQRLVVEINVIFEIVKSKIEYLVLKFMLINFIIVFRI